MLTNKEREGGIILLDLAKHICLAVAAAAVTLIVGSGKSKDKAKADEICNLVFHSFCDVEYDVAKFNNARRLLLEAVSAVM